MKAKPFCFASPIPADIDDDFRRFLAAGPQKRYNPWPGLVDESNLKQAWSNPFVKLLYVPTTKPDQFMERYIRNRLSIKEWYGVVHEENHLLLDFTPAKHLIRFYLAEIYHFVLCLITRKNLRARQNFSVEEKAWQLLNKRQEEMEGIFGQIELAEELVVTALSFHDLRQDLSKIPERAHEVQELDGFEKESIAKRNYTFRKLYPSFKKIIQLGSSFPSNAWLARLVIYLQPIVSDSSLPDSIKRCEKLASHMEEIKTAWQLIAWLNREIPRDDLLNWGWILQDVAKQPTWIEELPNEVLKNFWWGIISDLWCPEAWQTKDVDEKVNTLHYKLRNIREWYWDWNGSNPDQRISLLLYPQEINEHWYVSFKPWTVANDGNPSTSFYLEAFRQQLYHGAGIRCPLLGVKDGRHCTCSEGAFRIYDVSQLGRLATEGIFGDGLWTELPLPCDTAL